MQNDLIQSRIPGIHHLLSMVIIASPVLATVSLPGAAFGDDLADALRQALNSHPKIQADGARQRSVRATRDGARMGFLPTITATISRERSQSKNYTDPSTNQGLSNSNIYGISLTQPVFRGGRIVNGILRTNREFEAGVQDTLNSEQTVILESALAYSGLVKAQNVLALRETNIRIVERILRRTKAQRRAGDLTKTDVKLAEAELAEAEAAFVRAQSDYRISQEQYRRHFDSEPPSQVNRPVLPAYLLPENEEEAKQRAIEVNPLNLAAHHRAEAARYATREAFGAALPTVDLTASYTRTHNYSSSIKKKDDMSVGVEVSIPILNGGRNLTSIRTAKANEEQRTYEAIDTLRQSILSATTAYQEFIAAKLQIKANNARVVAAKVAAKGVRAEAKVGERSTSEILDAEQDSIDAMIALETSYFDRLAAGYQLLVATGHLTAEHVNAKIALARD